MILISARDIEMDQNGGVYGESINYVSIPTIRYGNERLI